MDVPKITIVTPCYNHVDFLERTIQSVLSQNYSNLEYIVIDGGSTDGSVEIIEKYSSDISYWVSERDEGQSHAINKGFRRATGDVMGWINSDDELLPNSLNQIGSFFSENPNKQWLVGSCELRNEVTGETSVRVTSEVSEEQMMHHLEDRWIPQQSTFWRRELFEKSGPVDEGLDLVMDWELWLRFFALAGEPGITEAELARYRFHEDAKSIKNRFHLAQEEAELHSRIQDDSSKLLDCFREESVKRLLRIAEEHGKLVVDHEDAKLELQENVNALHAKEERIREVEIRSLEMQNSLTWRMRNQFLRARRIFSDR